MEYRNRTAEAAAHLEEALLEAVWNMTAELVKLRRQYSPFSEEYISKAFFARAGAVTHRARAIFVAIRDR